MADIQKQFEKFHDTIRIDYELSKPLREKRDIILNRIRKHLKDNVPRLTMTEENPPG